MEAIKQNIQPDNLASLVMKRFETHLQDFSSEVGRRDKLFVDAGVNFGAALAETP